MRSFLAPRLPLFHRAALAAAAALFACAPICAETYTWTGGSAANNNWSTPANWINNSPPISSNTTDVLFAASPRPSPVHDLANPLTIRSLWFYDNTYSLTGNALVFDGEFAAIQNHTTTTISNSITLNANTSYEGAGNITFTGNIGGTGGLIKNGAGTVNLNNFTTFTGDTHINAGQIVLGHLQGLLFTTAHININNGLNISNQSAVIGGIAGSGNLTIGQFGLSVGGTNSSPTYSGQMTGTGRLTKSGTGTWTLTGAGSNLPTFTAQRGRTVLSGGSLTLTSTSSSEVSRALTVGGPVNGELEVSAGAVLNTSAGGSGIAVIEGAQSLAAMLTVIGAGSRWDAARIDVGISTIEPGALVVDNGGLVNATQLSIGKPAGGTLLVQNNSTVNATLLTVSNSATDPLPTVTLRSGGAANSPETILATPGSSIAIDRGTLTTGTLTSTAGNGSINLRDPSGGSALVISGTGASATYTGNISGVGGITKNGPSTQTLSGPNTYSGPTIVNGGTLVLSSGASASYTANSTGRVILNFGNLGHSSLRVAGGGTIQYPPMVVGGFIRGSDGSHDIRDVTSFNGTTFAVDSTLLQRNPLALNNVINSGALTNEAPLTWDGGVNTSAGRFILNAGAFVSSFENDGLMQINRRASLVNSGTDLVSGGGSRIIIEEQGALELNNKSELHLNGSLLINNGLIKGRTNVNFGALAKGAGEFGEVNVTDGGRFSPGNSPGTATTGTTTWNSAGSYVVEIADALAGAGVGWDTWNINGVLNLNASNTTNGRFTISLSSMDALAANFDPNLDYDWTILHATGGIGNFDPSAIFLDTTSFKNSFAGGSFSLHSTATDVIVRFSTVPEPFSAAIFAFVLIFGANRRRLRR